MSDKLYFKYWAKADRNEKAENPSFHLLPYHCLDVAAVGKVLLNRNKPLLDFFVENAGLDETTFVGTTLYFLALHDIGKFSDAFQGLREDLLHRLQGTTKSKPYDLRHDSLGFLLWQEHLEKQFCSAHLPDQDDQESVWDWQDFFEIWALAFTGHHGQPPKGSDRPVSRWFLSENIQAAEEFSQFCGAFFLNKVSYAAPEDFSAWNRQMRYLSWWLAGFVVLCDWLGSNSDFFHPHSKPLDLETYWQEIALPKAEQIIQKTDILPLPTRDPAPLSKLFPFISTPTPLQKKAGDIQLGRGPHLFILEDVTGAGKTEAA
ncbi:MAG: CRISPR-associated endonuclease Cas3'', partial [Candidatus Electrothrix sp. GM3_4]|nr:CRISPR-associated endonuclease Cas3'' [Candidatus Electrothrix sp. GM3_4]